jgi:hypothetical protein
MLGTWGQAAGVKAWNQPDVKGETHTNVALRQTIIAGGSAGPLTVTGIAVGDKLVSVLNTSDGVDLSDEFTITDEDEIDNTDGTATTGDDLIVTWLR